MTSRSSAYFRSGLVAITREQALALHRLVERGGLPWAKANDQRLLELLAPVLTALAEVRAEHAAERVAGVLPGGIPQPGESRILGMMTTTEVADLLKTSQRNVRALADRGSLRGERTPDGWRFDAEVVEEYVAEREAS